MMSCSPTDLQDYFLGELPESSRPKFTAHLKTCETCREEFDRLRITQAALMSLPDEEIPQRIRFVSDKVFEPSPVRRWLSALWGNNGKLAFASAAMLSGAILFSSLHRPAQLVAVTTSSPAPAVVPASSQPADVQQRIEEAVRKAVAESEERSAKKTAALLAEERRQSELARQEIKLQVGDFMDTTNKAVKRMQYDLLTASNESGRGPQ